MAKVDLNTVEDHCAKHSKKNESNREYFARVLNKLFKANSWVIYRGDRYIGKEGDKLSLYKKIEDAKD